MLILPPYMRGGPASAVLDAEADWIARSTAGGVTMATDFRTADEVDDYIHGDAQAANVTRDTTDGITGGGCLKILVPTTAGANSGSWRRGLNDAWTTDGQGFGATPYYIQFRCKLPASRFVQSNGGGGFKVANISGYKPENPNSSNSFTDHEIVINNQNWRGFPFVYRYDTVSPGTGHLGFEEPFGGADFKLQNAIDNGSGLPDNERFCLYSDSPDYVGCWHFPQDEWFTLYARIEIPSYGVSGGAGNKLDLYAAALGETSYTHLFDLTDFEIGSDAAYPNGQNGIHLLTYDTGRTDGSVETHQLYDQLIVSTSSIACPQV